MESYSIDPSSRDNIPVDLHSRQYEQFFDIRERMFPYSPITPLPSPIYSECTVSTFDYFASREDGETRLSTWQLWMYTCISAFGIGLVKGLVSWISAKLWKVRTDEMGSFSNASITLPVLPTTIYIAYSLSFGLVTCIIILFWMPGAMGGGIPEVKAFLNGNHLANFLSPLTLIGRVIGITLVTSCGVIAGPEGPMAHVGAIVTVLIASHFFLRKLSDRQIYDFAAIGSGMGISAAFTAPLAGPLFALEEAASYWHPELVARAFLGCLISAVVGSITSSGFECEDSEYCISVSGEFALTTYSQSLYAYRLWEIPLFVVPGVLAGIVSIIMTYCIIRIQSVRLYKKMLYQHPKFGRWIRIFDVAIVFSLTAVIILLSTKSSSCVEFSDTSNIPLSASFCDLPGQANPMSLLLLEPRNDAVASVFNSSGDSLYSPRALAIAGSISMFLAILTNGLSVPAGLFVPMCLIGSCFGRLSGLWVQDLTGGIYSIQPGVYAIAGAAGVLGGVSRMTLWVAVVVVEAVGDISLAIPVMISVIISKWICAFMLPHDLYDVMATLRGFRTIPFSDTNEVGTAFNLIKVGDIMTTPVICLHRHESASVMTNIVARTPYSMYPVLNSDMRVVATAKREEILQLLIARASAPTGLHSPGPCEVPTNYSHLSVNQDMSATKCYYLFSELGVKTIFVVDSENMVAGVLTRTNFFSKLS